MLIVTEVKTVVKYDRASKQWQAVNGDVKTFPAGDDGKRQALLCALAHDYPTLAAAVIDLAAMHDHNPALVDRLLKAAQLVTKGNVLANGRVKSQTTEGVVYQASYSDQPASYFCNCEDYDYGMQRHAGLSKWGGVDVDGLGLMCKHTLSQHLAWLTNWPLSEQEIPF